MVAQWLRIRLPVQETRVRSLVWKIPHAAVQLSLCTTTVEPALQASGTAMTEAQMPRVQAPQQEATPVRRPSTSMKSISCSLQLEKSPCSNEDPAQPKINKIVKEK